MNLSLLPQGYLLDGICTKSFISTNDDHKEQLMESDNKPVDYKQCADALLMMWMEYVISDFEYNRIMNKLNKAHEDGRI